MIEGRAQDDKQEQSERDGKPLAVKLMEDFVMITDGAMCGVFVWKKNTEKQKL